MNSAPRVLHALTNLDPATGGPAHALLGLAIAQRRAGIDARVLSCYRDGFDRALVEELQFHDVPVTLVGPVSARLDRHPALPEAIRCVASGVDAIHIHGVWEDIHVRAAAEGIRRGIPVFLRPCGMWEEWSLAHRGWKKRLYFALRWRPLLPRLAALHVMCVGEGASTKRALRMSELRTVVVPNGIDAEEFTTRPNRAFWRQRIDDLGEDRVLLFFGRVHEKKCPELLIDALALPPLQRGVRLVIAGPCDSSYRAQLEARARERGVAGRIAWIGAVTRADRVHALGAADLFALPSQQENFGNAIVESLGAGTRALIANTITSADELKLTRAVFVVPRTAESFAVAAAELLAAPWDERRRERTRHHALERYSWHRIAARWKKLYTGEDAP